MTMKILHGLVEIRERLFKRPEDKRLRQIYLSLIIDIEDVETKVRWLIEMAELYQSRQSEAAVEIAEWILHYQPKSLVALHIKANSSLKKVESIESDEIYHEVLELKEEMIADPLIAKKDPPAGVVLSSIGRKILADLDWQHSFDFLQQRLLDTKKPKPIELGLANEIKWALESFFHNSASEEITQEMVSQFMQLLWGLTPHQDGALFFQNFVQGEPRLEVWGIFLDCLLAQGHARKALFEIRTQLDRQHDLQWAEAAWRRLPVICELLGFRLFTWAPEQGSTALKLALSRSLEQSYIELGCDSGQTV